MQSAVISARLEALQQASSMLQWQTSWHVLLRVQAHRSDETEIYTDALGRDIY